MSTEDLCYKIVTDEILGRHLVATRDIEPGEIILKTAPVILGPKTVSSPLCLACHKKLNLSDARYECSKCHWPLCDKHCEKRSTHEKECQILATSGFKPTVQAEGRQSVYASIAPLRALMLKKLEPQKFQLLMMCQSHVQEHAQTAVYQVLKRTLVPFITDVLKIETDENEVLTICSIFDTNCFDVRDKDINIRGLYPIVCFVSHDCKHNTKHTFGRDFALTLTATVKIREGDLITATYTQTLWGTLERRAHLRVAKMFDCCCERCKDATELGTFSGSFTCGNCEGKLLSCDPLQPESDWYCDKCGLEVDSDEITWKNAILKREISALDKQDPNSFEDFLERYAELLHDRNTFCLQVKYALSQMYGHIEGFKLEELSASLVDRKIQLCEELLSVAQILESGLSRFRGLLLYDLFEALMVKVKRGAKELESRAVECFRDAHEILKSEPDMVDVVEKRKINLV